jgi:hypothetical protein
VSSKVFVIRKGLLMFLSSMWPCWVRYCSGAKGVYEGRQSDCARALCLLFPGSRLCLPFVDHLRIWPYAKTKTRAQARGDVRVGESLEAIAQLHEVVTSPAVR